MSEFEVKAGVNTYRVQRRNKISVSRQSKVAQRRRLGVNAGLGIQL